MSAATGGRGIADTIGPAPGAVNAPGAATLSASRASGESFMRAGGRNGVRLPGLPVLPPGVERHPVPGGGSRSVAIEAGDEVSVMNTAGLQRVELVLFAPDGRSDAAMLGARGHGAAHGIAATLAAGGASGVRVARALEAAGFDLARADAVRLFEDGAGGRPDGDVAAKRGGGTGGEPDEVTSGASASGSGGAASGAMETLVANSDGLLVIAAPGGPMAPDAQNAPSEVIVFVRRARAGSSVGAGKAPASAPDPLADALLDRRVRPGEASVYEVAAGQFMQILDVQGRECSDFQAFSRRALDAGLEREIDPTTTRSLSGSLYPAPGLYSKYFSVDHEPLVEIVEDTCGRHDTFGLACTARYYEDLGYPGHVNCSDNINRELGAFGVRPRGGWPAINFFFNTLLDESNAIVMDDPWSRPGDYVLLRALSDLVCVSTACPCDVDPANGWEPTDIQVRLYGAGEFFKRSIGWRRTPEGDVEQTRETGFHACFAEHTRDFIEYNGYWLPNSFTAHGSVAEYWACREKAAIMDLSPLRKYEITGPDAEALLQLGLTRDVKRLAVGQVVYTAMCGEHGGMIDDGTVFRLGENNFRWIGGSDASGLALRELAAARELNAWVRDSTEQLCNVAVQGPLSREILADVVWTAPTQPTIEELGWFRFAIGRIGDFHGPAVVVSRTGYSGELGYEVFCHPKDARAVFEAIWAAGEPRGMLPLGLAALDWLRIEAGLVFAGYEFDDRTDPFEAGIGFTVPLKSKTDDFVGRGVLEERKAHPRQRLVGLDVAGGVVPVSGDCVRAGRVQIGEVTSAVKSPILGRVIALARLDRSHAEVGTEVEIGQLDGVQKRLAATVSAFPHFDPEKERVKGNYSAA